MKKYEQISLNNISKSFEFEKMSREIDEITDINIAKDLAKSYIKLFMKQQEVLLDLNLSILDK